MADPKGRDLPRARTYQRAQRQRQAQYRDVKGVADLRRGRAESQRNIRQARRRFLAKRRQAQTRALLRFLGSPARVQGGGISTTKRGRLPGAAIDAASLGTPSVAGSLSRLTAGAGSAIVRDPVGTGLHTAAGLRDALTGIPSSLVKVAVDTVEGTKRGHPWAGLENIAKAYAKDAERRYGGLSKPGGVERFSKRVTKEGLAPELLDAAGVAAAGGATVGRGLTAAARTGRLGERVARVVTEPRRAARVSGGESRAQELSPNFLRAATQKAADERRARGQRKRVVRAGDRPLDAVLREAVARGEVVPRRVAGKQRRGFAVEKGRALSRMRREQAREIDKGARKAVGSLGEHERSAFKYAMQLGLPADPARARALVLRRRDQIAAERQASRTVVPRTLRATNDEAAALKRLADNADRAFTPRLAAVVRGEQARLRRVAEGDPGLSPVQAQLRRYAPQAAFLGVKRAEGESDGAFLRRVKAKAKAEGLVRPGYFPSEKRPSVRYSDRAVGGARAIVGPKRYTGALFRTGREDVRPVVHEQGLARNIKRKYNWNLVADQFDRHSFEWGRNRSVSKLLDELDRRGIDPSSVALWNPGRYRRERAAVGDAEGERTGRGEEPAVEGLDRAVDESAVTLEDLATRPEDFKRSGGWSVVPRALYDEIHADTRPSSFAGRAFDVVKGKQARVLLGLSPAWLQFQVASNALLTGLAGTGPADFVKAQVWWRKLSDAEKAAVEPYVGVGHFQDAVQQTKIGAARTRVESVNRMVDAYRALKQTSFLQRVGRGNPLDALFRADNAQNNAFRRGVLYSQVKRDAYRRMGENATVMARLQGRAQHLLTLGPEDQLKAVLRERPALERHAQHVNDFLGDYTTYTSRERRVLGRPIMFYGFLRYSLRFTFLTMPVKHPVMSAVIGQLGRLQADEVKKLLGGDELPWALGKLYFSKDGKLSSVDLSRANPALNAITNVRSPKDLAGLLPPLVVTALDQVYSKTSFRDRPFRVQGENQGRPSDQYTAEDRGRIALDQLLNLAAPYRALEKATQAGPQGDDSLLWSRRPTRYVDPGVLAGISADEQARPRGVPRRLLDELVPFIPRADRAPEVAAAIRRRQGVSSGASGPSVAPSGGAGPSDPVARALQRLAGRGGRALSPEAQEALRRIGGG